MSVDADRWPLTRVWLWADKYYHRDLLIKIRIRILALVAGKYTQKELRMLQNWASWYGE